MRAWRASICDKTARTSASLKTTGTRRALRALDVVEPFDLPPEDLFAEEHDSAKRLILGRTLRFARPQGGSQSARPRLCPWRPDGASHGTG
jgi:hypothetical protein